jgi:hypothetical protein
MRFLMARACVILFLFLAACSTGRPEIAVHSELNDPCFLPLADGTAWDLRKLPPDLRKFYAALASNARVSLDQLLGGLAGNYEARGYTVGEFYEVLRSLHRLLVTVVPTDSYSELRTPHTSLLSGQLGEEPAILFVDPTCDVCKLKLDLIVRIQKDCPSSSPPLELVVLPGGDEYSLKAAAALQRISIADPDAYPHAVIEFLTLLPDSPSRIDDLASIYLGDNYDHSEQFLVALDSLQTERQGRLTSDLHAPLLVFRGRIIERDTSNNKPFDPFRDYKILALTFRLIVLLDAEKGT